MDVESERAPLAELFRLLTDRQITAEEEEELTAEALSALADPAAYAEAIAEADPSLEWIGQHYLTGDDPATDGRLLLRWIIYNELGTWVCCSDKLDELLQRIDDRIAEVGVEMEPLPYDYDEQPEDPLEHYCRRTNEALAKASGQTKALVRLGTGMSDEFELYVVSSADRPRLFALAEHYQLDCGDSWS